MSNQFNKSNQRNHNRNFSDRNKNQNYNRNPQFNHRSNPLAKLHEECNPPFRLNFKWSSTDFYKLKIPHPFYDDEKETVTF